MIPGIVAGALLASGAPEAPAWTPADLPSGKEGWYDASQQTEGDGNTVANFVNRFGNSAFDFVSIGADPTLRHNQINGKASIDFGGTGLQVSSANDMLEGVTSCSLFMVAKGDSDPSSSGPDEAPLNGFGTGGVSHLFTDGKWYEAFGTSSRRDVDPPTSWASNYRIMSVESASNSYIMRWDGTDLQVTASPNTVATGTANRRMGDREGGGAGTFAGHIAEVLILSNVPSTNNRYRIEGYYAHKYGKTGDLPTNHPYRTVEPTSGPALTYQSQSISTTAAATITPIQVVDGGSPLYELVDGTLPTGLSLNASTGEITGTPSGSGTFSGIEIRVTDGAFSATCAAFSLTVVTGFRYIFQEFLASGNMFQGCATLKLIDGGAVDRALASNGATISPVGYTENLPSFPVANMIDGNDATFSTSATGSAGTGKGQLIDMGGLHDIDKWGYRSRPDSVGSDEAITSGKLWAKVEASDPYTLIYTISEASWGDDEYRERTI